MRLGTHVFNIGLRHPFTTARGVQTVDLLSNGRFEFGIGASWLEEEWDATAARLRDAWAARRRSGRGLQAALHRGDDLAPRRVLLVRRGGVRAEAGAEAVAADPRRRRVEGGAAARGASRRRLDRHGAHARVGRGPDRRRCAGCSPSTGGSRCRSRSCSVGPVTSADDVRRWEDIGVTRMIVSPWRRSPEAVEAMQRFADGVHQLSGRPSARCRSSSGACAKSRIEPTWRSATSTTPGCIV